MSEKEIKNPLKHHRYTPAEKENFYAQWKASSLSRTAFCKIHHLNVASFCHWVKKCENKPKPNVSLN